MSPLFVNAEGRGRYAPADRRAEALLFRTLVEDAEEFSGNLPGLYSDEIDEICDLLVIAEAYLDLLESNRPIQEHLQIFHDYVRLRMDEIATEQVGQQ